MSRKAKHKFPSEYEEDLLLLIENYGDFHDINGVAEHYGVSTRSLLTFMKTKRAKEARARYAPGSRELLRKNPHALPSAAQEPALPDSERLDADRHWTIFEPYSEGRSNKE